MGFWSFMGHRALAIFLAIITLGIVLISTYKAAFVSSNYYYWIIVAVLTGIASAYFFKTQH